MKTIVFDEKRLDAIAAEVAAALGKGAVAVPMLGGTCVLSRDASWLRRHFGAAFRLTADLGVYHQDTKAQSADLGVNHRDTEPQTNPKPRIQNPESDALTPDPGPGNPELVPQPSSLAPRTSCPLLRLLRLPVVLRLAGQEDWDGIAPANEELAKRVLGGPWDTIPFSRTRMGYVPRPIGVGVAEDEEFEELVQLWVRGPDGPGPTVLDLRGLDRTAEVHHKDTKAPSAEGQNPDHRPSTRSKQNGSPDSGSVRIPDFESLSLGGKDSVSAGPVVVDRKGSLGILELERILGEHVRLGPGVVFSVLIVCTGNMCRSPMAAGLLDKRLAGAQAFVYSAGTGAPVGSAATRTAVEAVSQYGVDLSRHRAQALTRELASAADLILVMEEHHRQAVLELDPLAEPKTRLLLEYAEPNRNDAKSAESEANGEQRMASSLEVPDPVDRPLETYLETIRLMQPALDKVAEEIESRK